MGSFGKGSGLDALHEHIYVLGLPAIINHLLASLFMNEPILKTRSKHKTPSPTPYASLTHLNTNKPIHSPAQPSPAQPSPPHPPSSPPPPPPSPHQPSLPAAATLTATVTPTITHTATATSPATIPPRLLGHALAGPHNRYCLELIPS